MPLKSVENKVQNIKENSIENEMGYGIIEDIKKNKNSRALVTKATGHPV